MDLLERKAADQIRAIARFRNWRPDHRWIYPGRRAPRVALALGYYRPPFQGFQFAAFAQKLRRTGRQLEGRNIRDGLFDF